MADHPGRVASRPPAGGDLVAEVHGEFPRYGRQICVSLLTLIAAVGPLLLHLVAADLLDFPGADIAYFAIVVVIPSLSGDWVSDGFA
jgi:hypothetical protein